MQQSYKAALLAAILRAELGGPNEPINIVLQAEWEEHLRQLEINLLLFGTQVTCIDKPTPLQKS